LTNAIRPHFATGSLLLMMSRHQWIFSPAGLGMICVIRPSSRFEAIKALAHIDRLRGEEDLHRRRL